MQYHTVDLDQDLDKNPDLLEAMGDFLGYPKLLLQTFQFNRFK